MNYNGHTSRHMQRHAFKTATFKAYLGLPNTFSYRPSSIQSQPITPATSLQHDTDELLST